MGSGASAVPSTNATTSDQASLLAKESKEIALLDDQSEGTIKFPSDNLKYLAMGQEQRARDYAIPCEQHMDNVIPWTNPQQARDKGLARLAPSPAITYKPQPPSSPDHKARQSTTFLPTRISAGHTALPQSGRVRAPPPIDFHDGAPVVAPSTLPPAANALQRPPPLLRQNVSPTPPQNQARGNNNGIASGTSAFPSPSRQSIAMSTGFIPPVQGLAQPARASVNMKKPPPPTDAHSVGPGIATAYGSNHMRTTSASSYISGTASIPQSQGHRTTSSDRNSFKTTASNAVPRVQSKFMYDISDDEDEDDLKMSTASYVKEMIIGPPQILVKEPNDADPLSSQLNTAIGLDSNPISVAHPNQASISSMPVFVTADASAGPSAQRMSTAGSLYSTSGSGSLASQAQSAYTVGPPSQSGNGHGGPGVGAPVTPFGSAVGRQLVPLSPVPAVKETKAVKRNRAQLPAQLTHAQPTTGDWLKKRYIVNNYILLDTLGEGSYGEVRLCKDRTTDGLFAIKIISKELLKKQKSSNTSETYFEDIKREIAIMKKLLHPNVLRLFEVLDDPKINKLYLVLEYMKQGDLVKVLKDREKEFLAQAALEGAPSNSKGARYTPLNDHEYWIIFRQVTAGLRYLHYQDVVHGDIKPQNLLIGEDGVVKIADFGISRMLSDSRQNLADAAGTPAFMSPELCAFKEGDVFSGQKADIWALGATMFMIRFGNPPFIANNIGSLATKIRNDPLVFPLPLDPGLEDLLRVMLIKDPAVRSSLQQVLMHPWMRYPPPLTQQQRGGTQQQQQYPGSPSSHAARSKSNINYSPSSTAAAMRATQQSSSSPSHSTSPQNEVAAMAHAGMAQYNNAIMMSISAELTSTVSKFQFNPPASYHVQEEEAMCAPINSVSHADLFHSIQVGNSQPRKKTSSDAIDEESQHALSDDAIDALDEDVMATKWGADVFEMVNDGDHSDSDDDEEEEVDSSDEARRESERGGGANASLDEQKSLASMRTDMSAEESENRAKRFHDSLMKNSINMDMNALKAKISTNYIKTNDQGGLKADTSDATVMSISGVLPSPSPKFSKKNPDKQSRAVAGVNPDVVNGRLIPPNRPSLASGDGIGGNIVGPPVAGPPPQQLPNRGTAQFIRPSPLSKPSIEYNWGSPDNVSQKLHFSSASTASTPIVRAANPAHRFSEAVVDDEEFTAELSMDDFAKMMDTLALQPKPVKSNEEISPLPISLKPSDVCCEQVNSKNGVAAAYFSAQGTRPRQEDRCILILDISNTVAAGTAVANLKSIAALAIVSGTLKSAGKSSIPLPDDLQKISIAAVFDGHSGMLCSEYLKTCFAQQLISHPKLLDKNLDVAILETFRALDKQICQLLREEDDSSGSTANIAVYDGRRHVLTVANVGDSMCVLSRAGRAVVLLRSHRLEHAEECDRIRKAGGAVMNNRVNGVLAVSRAFGDIQFKGDDLASGPVIAVPDICSEVITPMTEFAIIGTDGLWDVLSPQVAINFVRKKIYQKLDLEDISRLLVDEAIGKGSVDNVSALIMTFNLAHNSSP